MSEGKLSSDSLVQEAFLKNFLGFTFKNM